MPVHATESSYKRTVSEVHPHEVGVVRIFTGNVCEGHMPLIANGGIHGGIGIGGFLLILFDFFALLILHEPSQ